MLYHTKIPDIMSGDHTSYKCDLENNKEVESTLIRIAAELGEPYAYIHAAGTGPARKKFLAVTEEDMHEQFTHTVMQSFNFFTNTAARLKTNGNGVLIGITTAGVLHSGATAGLGAYIPAKYAVQGMLTMLHNELAPHMVRVYSIAPGFMAGGMNAEIPKAFVEMIKVKSATHTITDADLVAEKIIELCDPDTTLNDFTVLIAPEL